MTAGIGGLLLSSASTAVNGVMLAKLVGEIGVSFFGGFSGSLLGTLSTSKLDKTAINKSSLIVSSLLAGSLNLVSGLASGITTSISNLSNSTSALDTKVAIKMLAGIISSGGEIVNDIVSLIVGVLY